MKKAIQIISAVLLCVISAGSGFIAGRLTMPKQETPVIAETVTFYATITTISEYSILVEGLEVNDINSRGAFDLSTNENTVYEWRHTPLERSELEAGDTIAVTYTGAVLESYPAQIHEVLKIQLLDDEK